MIKKEIFGERLALARKWAHLTQQALADILNVTRPVIAQYENGFRLPLLEHAVLMAETLNMPLEFLLGLSDDPHGALHSSMKGEVPLFNDDLLKREGFAPCVDCGCTERKVLSRPFVWFAWPLTDDDAPKWPDSFISPVTGNVSVMKGYLRTCPDCGHAEWTTRPPTLADSFLADADPRTD